MYLVSYDHAINELTVESVRKSEFVLAEIVHEFPDTGHVLVQMAGAYTALSTESGVRFGGRAERVIIEPGYCSSPAGIISIDRQSGRRGRYRGVACNVTDVGTLYIYRVTSGTRNEFVIAIDQWMREKKLVRNRDYFLMML
ncbi:MAG: hypothetical protein JW763_06135 [candidate division Zixibacteria bacterium]|nr:hypothetical protein [candidate division Zixibacteria bacterium]